MGLLVLFVLMFATIGGSDAAWCVCKPDQNTAALQKTLDYACGAGADCTPIIQNGACYNPNTVVAHCSYAVNSYYQRKGQTQGACDFTGTATLSSTDPSSSGCTYPATPSAAGTSSSTPSTTPSTGTPSTTPTTGTPSTFTPTGTTGSGGVLGLGPAGTTSYDGSHGGLPPKARMMSSLFLTFFLFLALFKA
ncbi:PLASMODESMATA CALLOSE-BINDING PROTEIN 2-like [Typha angustifolia]|uniref:PLASMODESMATA CALLOSE-BINDING PROTEIN 2-like n=1 Tax=Typha angustifolia TaxID=59011 RepID=UPI003C309062